jgi:ADP-ribosylglycohydrolase
MAAMAGAISSARLGPAALPETLLSRINDRNEWGADALSVLARACALLADENEVRR